MRRIGEHGLGVVQKKEGQAWSCGRGWKPRQKNGTLACWGRAMYHRINKSAGLSHDGLP